MKNYRVIWEIDIEAGSSVEAAILARKHQEPGTSSVVFDVWDEEGEQSTVDLEYLPEYGTFTQYLETALWASPNDHGNGSVSNFHPETINELRAEFLQWWADHFLQIQQFMEKAGVDESGVAHDLWLTRNGHGTGFWDRGAGEIGETLTSAAEAIGPKTLYLGDDSNIYTF